MLQLVRQDEQHKQQNGTPRLSGPRLGFLGLGWIGRHRLRALQRSGVAQVAAVADPSAVARLRAGELAREARLYASLQELLDADLDGLVIATPTALHAEQAIRALEAGLSVFCQKPLARNRLETEKVLAAAQKADRLLAVDLSYRHIDGTGQMRELIRDGSLGHVYALDLTFHNSHGPEKEWCYDPALSGGGCVVDQGIQLIDLALWLLDYPAVAEVTGRLFAGGRPLASATAEVEDYAVAELALESDALIRMASSWKASVGVDAQVEVTVRGTAGGLRLRNRNGSSYSFTVEHLRGTTRHMLAQTFEDWGWSGQAAISWARRLGQDPTYDPAAGQLAQVAGVLDRIYGRD